MLKFNEQLKKEYANIKPDPIKKREIYDKIVASSKVKPFILNPVYIGVLGLVLLVSVFGIVYADEITEAINTFKVQVFEKEYTNGGKYHTFETETSAIADINCDAFIPEVETESAHWFDDRENLKNNKYTYEELEALLDTKILKSNLFKYNKIHQVSTTKVDNKIATASFKILNATNTDMANLVGKRFEFIDMSFNFKTKYGPARKKMMAWFTPQNYDTYYINNLKTNAIVVNHGSQYIVQFDYNNINYTLEFVFSVRWSEEDAYVRVIEILNSLSY